MTEHIKNPIEQDYDERESGEQESRDHEPSKNYSDREVALILRHAMDLQERSGGTHHEDGLPIEVVREIAREVGLEPKFVDQAATSLRDRPESRLSVLFGGSPKYQLEERFPRKVTPEDQAQLVEVIRRTLRHQGEMSEALGSLQWNTKGTIRHISVTITPRDQETTVSIIGDIGDTGEIGALVWIIPLLIGFGTGGIINDGLQPENLLTFLSILGAGGAAGFVVARTIWSKMTRAFRRQARSLLDEITGFLSK